MRSSLASYYDIVQLCASFSDIAPHCLSFFIVQHCSSLLDIIQLCSVPSTEDRYRSNWWGDLSCLWWLCFHRAYTYQVWVVNHLMLCNIWRFSVTKLSLFLYDDDVYDNLVLIYDVNIISIMTCIFNLYKVFYCRYLFFVW